MKETVVIGSDGQLGQCLQTLNPDWTFLTQDDLDLRDPENVRLFFSDEKPNTIVNLAAYTAVDNAEEEEDIAITINAESAGALAENCKHYFYISTDYVFDGKSKKPYRTDYPKSPINAYGNSKHLGEVASLEANPNTVVVRTSWLYSEFGHNFVKSMLRLAAERDSLKVVNDQVGSPTYAMDLAETLVQLAKSIGSYEPGIYHYTNSGECSWYEFALEIFKIKDINISIAPVSSSDFTTLAKRPEWSVLDTSKIIQIKGVKLYQWKESLKKCLAKI